MKTKKYSLILSSVALFCAIEGKSQNWLTSGNTLGGSEILGSTGGNFPLTIQNGAAYPINFSTNGSQVGTFLSNGNFGIGTAAPTNILSLGNGSAQKIWIENTASGTVGRALTVAAGSTVGGTNITGGEAIIQAGLGTGTGASNISFQTGTTLGSGTTLQTMSTKMTILGSGNVGIGTTTPTNKLDVEGGVAIGSGYSGTSTAPTDGAIIQGQVAIGSSAPIQVAQTGSPSKVTIAEITNNTVLHIKEYANTTALPLLVFGKSRGTSIGSEVATQSNDIFGALAFEGVNTSNAPAVGGSIRMYQDGAGGATFIPGRFEFWTATAAAAPAVKMTLTSGGNLGINTTAPSQKLEVQNGNILLSNTGTAGELRFAENSVNGVHYSSFKAAVSQLNNINYTLPAAQATTSNQVLTNDGSGALSWNTFAAGTTGATGASGATGAIGVTGATGVAGSVNAWGLTGTSGTVDGTNFIGTIDNVPFNIRVNNNPSGRIESNPTTANTFYGYLVGSANTTGNRNTANGYEALTSNTVGRYNTAIGNKALRNNVDGEMNTALGTESLYTNTSGIYNTATGYGTLYSNTTGKDNTANGAQALYYNTTGLENCAFGNSALLSNTSGSYNTSVGGYSLLGNTSGGYNTAVGSDALRTNSTGGLNTALGFHTMRLNETGTNNTATGAKALQLNVSGSYNTAHGFAALHFNTGDNNTAFGNDALINNTTGYNNTAVGYAAGSGSGINTDTACTFVGYGATSSNNYNNASAFGSGVTVNARNKVRIGDVNVLVIEGQVAWSFPSDSSFKTNVQEDVKGLEFIKKLRPVTYQFNTDEFDQFLMQNMPDSIKAARIQGIDYTASKSVIHNGFIAQEVEQAANECEYIFDGVNKPSNDNDNYSVAYSQFVVPLVKAVQELSKHNDSLATVNVAQDTVDNALQTQVNQLVASNASLQEQVNALQNTTDTTLQTQVNQLMESNALLQEQVNALMGMVNNCCTATNEGRSFMGGFSNPNQTLAKQTEVQLSNKNIIVLEQNVPNPFAEQTTINYNIPTTVNRAQIVFFDLSGQIIKSVEITEKGIGQLNVFASDLSSGIYTYSLIADGVAMETKKMVKR